MTTEVYPPLPTSTSIRTLSFEVLPGSSEIRGRFTIIDLDDEHHAKYEALSYAWGDPAPVTRVLFDGSGLKIGIAQNLADGLARLHRDGQTDLIWIDAICIDQRNVKEQNHQVQIMGRVYSEATLVKIWLGLGNEALMADAFDLLQRCANPLNDHSDGIETLEKMGGALSFERTAEWSARMAMLVPDPDLQDDILEAVFDKPWFERLWTVQEVWLGKNHIVLAGVGLSMRYDIICRGAFFLKKGQANIFKFYIAGVDNLLQVFEARCQGTKLNLKNLMRFDHWKASEERDCVYALLAVTEIPQSVPQYFVVDYNKPAHKVFMDATRGVVEATKDLSILSCSTSAESNSASWSQRWARTAWPHISYTRAFEMLADSKALIGAHTRPDELRLAGRCFQTVGSVCEVKIGIGFSARQIAHHTMHWYNWSLTWCMRSRGAPARLRSKIFSRYRLADLRKFDEVFAIIVMGGVVQMEEITEPDDFSLEWLLLPYFYKYFHVWANGVLSDGSIDRETRLLASSLLDAKTGILPRAALVDLGEEVVQGTIEVGGSYQSWLTLATMNSSFFRTCDGLLGMAKGDIKVGDQICALYGGKYPFVLRRDESGNYWRVIGTAFMDPKRFNDPAYWEAGEEQWFGLI